MPDEGWVGVILGTGVGLVRLPGCDPSVDGSAGAAIAGVTPPLVLRVSLSLRDIPHSPVIAKQLPEARARTSVLRTRYARRSRRPADLPHQVRVALCKLRVRVFECDRNTARERRRRKAIVIRQLPVDLRLQQILGVLHRKDVAGLVSVNDDAKLRLIVTQAAAHGKRALRAAQCRHRQLRHQYYAVRS